MVPISSTAARLPPLSAIPPIKNRRNPPAMAYDFDEVGRDVAGRADGSLLTRCINATLLSALDAAASSADACADGHGTMRRQNQNSRLAAQTNADAGTPSRAAAPAALAADASGHAAYQSPR